MNKKEKWLGMILVISTILTETHSVLLAYNEDLDRVKIDLFPFLKFSLSILWYFKMLFENFLVVIIFFVVGMLKDGYSKGFLKIICLNVFYHVFDFISFVLNYKETYQLYWLVLGIITIWELFIIFGKRNKLKIV